MTKARSPLRLATQRELEICLATRAVGSTQGHSVRLDITGRYLMALHTCDRATAECRDPRHHQVYLAQSDDGAR